MARMLPRRLGHDEEASLVDHLTELRHRLFICLGSIIPAFALAYAEIRAARSRSGERASLRMIARANFLSRVSSWGDRSRPV